LEALAVAAVLAEVHQEVALVVLEAAASAEAVLVASGK
jgi:hypothetical protein